MSYSYDRREAHSARPPASFREDPETGQLFCPHRDVSCCPQCAKKHPEIVEVHGQHFWTHSPKEKEELLRLLKQAATRKFELDETVIVRPKYSEGFPKEPGTIHDIKNGKYEIHWKNGETGWFPSSDLRKMQKSAEDPTAAKRRPAKRHPVTAREQEEFLKRLAEAANILEQWVYRSKIGIRPEAENHGIPMDWTSTRQEHEELTRLQNNFADITNQIRQLKIIE